MHQRAPGHAGLAWAWITLLVATITTVLFGLAHAATAAEWAGAVGFSAFLLILAIVDVTAREPQHSDEYPEASVEETLSLPWWEERD